MRFLITAAKGLEEVVAEELRRLGLKARTGQPGLLAMEGALQDAWRACLWLRAGRRVLMPLGEFDTGDAQSLYEGSLALPWDDVLDPDGTFAVEASVRDSAFTHSGFVALKVKDAVADAFRARRGRRPSVDKEHPDARVVVHVGGQRAMVSLDLSGGPLHKRGYRVKSIAAPLNETLAAGILLLSGYDGGVPFADPFCGSGTICIEAALIATRLAPGLLRKGPFGFERQPGFRPEAWTRMKKEALGQLRAAPCPLWGSDTDPSAVAAARANAGEAGMEKVLRFAVADARNFTPPAGGPGLIATNPPYGDHAGQGEDLPVLYKAFGDALKRNFPGWRAMILSGNTALAKSVGLHPKRKHALYNGPLECRLLELEMYEGTKKGRQESREP